VSKDAVEELGDDFGTNIVGTGPYELAEYKPGVEVVLERFDDYGGAAYEHTDPVLWERIVFKEIADGNAADIALESGELDFGIVSSSGFSRFAEDDDFEVEEQATLDYGWVGMNVTDDVLSDIAVRRAIRSALDVDAMITAGFDDQVTRADALIAPGNPIGYWEDAPRYEQDLDAAADYLDSAGIDDLTLTMTINEQAGSRAIAEIVQANLAEIGITVDIDLVDDSEFLDAGAAGTLQLFYQSFTNSPDPSWATVWFTCDQVGDWNWMAWCNEEFDELHDAALIEREQDVRDEYYVEMQQIMDEEAVAAWVMYRNNLYAYTADLQPSLLPARSQFRAWDFRR
jgi:peptide/nickel transport system substrate-binding protein